MSAEVDTKTVEMRFDNADFEKHAKQSMSTLSRLKAALKLDGASTGLKEIEKASKQLDFKDVHKGLDETGKRFGILQTIANGALLKIGMTAADVGMNIAKSLAGKLVIDQVKSGWDKYEKKITAVQTIMTNLKDTQGRFVTESQKMDYVARYINRLAKFADETSYGFSDMTDNLGKWIANGRDLEESVTAIQGVATWAAAAGQAASTGSFARAAYNISQAFGLGAMTTLDWKSIEQANMATAQFKELAIQTAITMGKIKEGDVTVDNFRNTLQKKWFDNDVMMEVFKVYGSAGEKIMNFAEESGISVEMAMQHFRETDKEFANSLGFKAFEAAQAAKTFSEVVDATADAVSTKWTQIFENIFGNYLQAKELWSDFSISMWDVFAGPLDTLNEIMTKWNKGFLENGPGRDTLSRMFDSGLLDDFDNGLSLISRDAAKAAVASNSATYAIQKLSNGTEVLVKKIEKAPGKFEYISKTIYNGDSRLLSGREMLLQGFRNIFDTVIHDVEDDNGNLESMSFFGSLKRGLQEVIFGTSEVDKLVPLVARKLWDLTKRFKEFTESMKPSMETSLKIKNAFKGLLTLFKIAGKLIGSIIKPFKNFFGNILKGSGKTILDLSDSMGTWIQKLDEFLDSHKIFDTISEKISSGLNAISAAIDNLSLSITGMTVKDLGKYIKERVFGFFASFDFKGTFSKVKDFFSNTYKSIKNGINSISKSLTGKSAKQLYSDLKQAFAGFFEKYDFKTAFGTVVGFLSNAVARIGRINTDKLSGKLKPLKDFLSGLKGAFSSFQSFFSYIGQGLSGIVKRIKDFIAGLGNNVSSGSSDKLAKYGPLLEGLKYIFKGLSEFFVKISPALVKIGKWIGQFFSNLGDTIAQWAQGNPEQVIDKLIKGGSLIALFKLISSIRKFLKVVGQKKTIGDAIAGIFKPIGKVLTEYAKEIHASALIEIAIAIGILSGSLWLLSKIPKKDLIPAGIALAVIATGVALLTKAAEHIANIRALKSSSKSGGPLDSVKDMLTAVVGKSIFANDATAKFVKIMLGILFAAKAAEKIVSAVQKAGEVIQELSDIDKGKLAKGGKIFAQIVLVFGVFALLASFGNSAKAALFAAIGAFLLVKAVAKFVEFLSELGSDSTKMDNIQKVVDKFPKVFEALKRAGSWIIKIAAAIAIAQVVIAAFSTGKETNPKGIAKVLKEFGKNFMRIGLALVLVAAAFAIMAAVAKNTDANNFNAVSGFLIAFMSIIGGLMVVAIGLLSYAKNGKNFSNMAKVLKEFGKVFTRVAFSLILVAAAFAIFSLLKFKNTDITTIGNAFGIFLGVVAILAIVAGLVAKEGKKVSSRFAKNIKSIGLLFIAVAASLVIVAAAFKLMDTLEMSSAQVDTVANIFGNFIGVIAILAAVVALLATIRPEGAGKATGTILAIAGLFIAVAGAMVIMALAFQIMDKLDPDKFVTVATIFGIFVAVLAVAAVGLVALSSGLPTAGLAIGTILSTAALFVAAAGALWIVAQAFAVMDGLDPSNFDKVGELFAGFGIVVIALAALGIVAGMSGAGIFGVIAVAGLIVVAAGSLLLVAYALSMLIDTMSKSDLKKVQGVLDAFVGAIDSLVNIGSKAVKGVVGVVGLAAIAVFLIAVGAACLIAGIGIGIIVVAFAKFTEAFAKLVEVVADKGPAFVSNISGVINGIIDAVINAAPKLAQAGAVIITALAQGIGNSAGAIAAAGILVLLAFADTFFSTIDEIGGPLVDSMITAIKNIAQKIRESAPDFVMAVYDLSTALLEALELMGKAVGAKAEATWNFIQDGLTGKRGGKKLSDYWKDAGNDLEAEFKGVAEKSLNAASEKVKGTVEVGVEVKGDPVGDVKTKTEGEKVTVPVEATTEKSGTNEDPLANLRKKAEVPIEVPVTYTTGGATGGSATLGMPMAIPGLSGGTLNFMELIGASDIDFSGITNGLSGAFTNFDMSGIMDGKMNDLYTSISTNRTTLIDPEADKLASDIKTPVTSLDSYTWGTDIDSGLSQGLIDKIPDVKAAAGNVAAVIHDILGFSEPKEGPLSNFHTYAPDMIKLWCSGIRSNLGMVDSSVTTVADRTYDGFSSALEYVSDLIDNGISDDLTIRPVMDLTGIQNGVDSIGSMMSDNQNFVVNGTARLAARAAVGVGANGGAIPVPEAMPGVSNSTNNTFYITGNNPKAIAEEVSKILGDQTRRAKATWAKKK